MSGGFRGRQGGIRVRMSGAKAVSTLVPFLFARLLHVLEMVFFFFFFCNAKPIGDLFDQFGKFLKLHIFHVLKRRRICSFLVYIVCALQFIDALPSLQDHL